MSNCNFKIYADGTFGNECHKENGTCCFYCKYSVEAPKESVDKWIPWSDFCIKLKGIKEKSCLDCRHKPSYMK